MKKNKKKLVDNSVSQEVDKHEDIINAEISDSSDDSQDKKIFKKFLVKDIVYLAIIAAVMILTSAVMPIVRDLTKKIFGIAQLVTAFQLSLFACIGLMKVKKVGSLTFLMIFMGVIMVAMAPIMFLSNILIAIVAEWIIVLLVFRGYRSNLSCYVAAALIGPLSIPTYIVYNYVTKPDTFTKLTQSPGMAVGITFAVIALSMLGALIGYLISRELAKGGVIKK